MHLLNPGEGLKSKHADATVHVHPLFFSVEKVHISEHGALRLKFGSLLFL